ncbi:hypothetical protein ACOMCU_16260 [Lysinibacillus sp. UGB7]|uniref:hypothetical protein n=1 Tax=Lysinibacillus sp. UGB7 TaxID=3411039 RepID=UPI003B798D4B
MEYQKPLCECSEELLVLDNVHSNNYRITKDGKVSKRKIGKPAKEGWGNELFCENCGNVYALDEDEQKRVVRGEIQREGF